MVILIQLADIVYKVTKKNYNITSYFRPMKINPKNKQNSSNNGNQLSRFLVEIIMFTHHFLRIYFCFKLAKFWLEIIFSIYSNKQKKLFSVKI